MNKGKRRLHRLAVLYILINMFIFSPTDCLHSQTNTLQSFETLSRNSFTSFDKIFSAIKSKFPQKNEFESWETYKSRCLNACSNNYTIAIDLGDFRKKRAFSYNPENQTITFSIPTSFGTGISSNITLHGIEVSDFQKTGKIKGNYLGSNAFGVTKNVKVVNIKYDILSAQYEIYKQLKFDFQSDPESAKAIQANFAIAVNFSIDCKRNVPSLATTEKKYSTPTIDAPFSGANIYNVIPVTVHYIAIYNQKTYKVYTVKQFD